MRARALLKNIRSFLTSTKNFLRQEKAHTGIQRLNSLSSSKLMHRSINHGYGSSIVYSDTQKLFAMKALLPLLLIFCIWHFGFKEDNSEERFDTGYNDGYAAGYNTTCNIRSTLIEGDWENEDYTEGYEYGYSDGSRACLNR